MRRRDIIKSSIATIGGILFGVNLNRLDAGCHPTGQWVEREIISSARLTDEGIVFEKRRVIVWEIEQLPPEIITTVTTTDC